jgi:hypothetical protein
MRGLTVLVLATLLVLAGCNAPGSSGTTSDAAPTATATPTPSPTPTPTDEGLDQMTVEGTTPVTEPPSERPPVRITSGSLPADVDANATLRRVETLTALDVSHLDLSVVEPKPDSTSNPDGFFEAVGFAPTDEQFLEVTGQYREQRVTVRVSENASRAEVETVLVHEFAHALQFNSEQFTIFWASRSVETLDDWFVARAMIEGPTVYVTEAYSDRYDERAVNQTETMQAIVEDGSPWAGYLTGHYYYGARYARSRVDSPKTLSALYRDAPRTSEQVLHGYRPADEPPADLSVAVHTDDGWVTGSDDAAFFAERTTAGEVLVRFVLRTELEPSAADSAAAGWGNDSVVRFTDGNSSGYAWVLRWDTVADAGEFAEAFRTYRERGGGNVSAWRLERVGDRTTVVVGGDQALLEAVSVTASGAEVNVSVGAATAGGDRIRPPRPGSVATPSRRR